MICWHMSIRTNWPVFQESSNSGFSEPGHCPNHPVLISPEKACLTACPSAVEARNSVLALNLSFSN